MTNKLVFPAFIIAAGFSILMSGCAKEETSSANNETIGNKITYTYIVNGKSYPITVQEQQKDSFVIVSEVNDTLANVLNCETSALLQDPFNKKTYYAFKTEEESKATNTEILRKLNQYELQYQTIKANNNLKAARVGHLMGFKERYYITPIVDVFLENNGSRSFTGVYSYANDELSSYQVYRNTLGARPDGKRYVIRFYTNSDFTGDSFVSYSDFQSELGNDGIALAHEEDNLHGLVRYVNWTKRRYWGDCVSSIRWTLE